MRACICACMYVCMYVWSVGFVWLLDLVFILVSERIVEWIVVFLGGSRLPRGCYVPVHRNANKTHTRAHARTHRERQREMSTRSDTQPLSHSQRDISANHIARPQPSTAHISQIMLIHSGDTHNVNNRKSVVACAISTHSLTHSLTH